MDALIADRYVAALDRAREAYEGLAEAIAALIVEMTCDCGHWTHEGTCERPTPYDGPCACPGVR